MTIEVTQDDLARDLRADLAKLEGSDGRAYERWVLDNVDNAWPAAIRRALAAEARVAQLNDSLADLGEVTAAKQEGLERLAARKADARVEVNALRAENRELRAKVERLERLAWDSLPTTADAPPVPEGEDGGEGV